MPSAAPVLRPYTSSMRMDIPGELDGLPESDKFPPSHNKSTRRRRGNVEEPIGPMGAGPVPLGQMAPGAGRGDRGRRRAPHTEAFAA